MNALRFKRLSSAFAAACLAVGRGQRLAFTSAEDAVQLTLGPLLASGSELPEQRLHLSSQHGALHLSNADALLSLCGEIPVISAGPMQGWYWQLINQQLAVALHDLLAPLGTVHRTALFCTVGGSDSPLAASALAGHFARRGILVRRFDAHGLVRFGLPGRDEEWQRLAAAVSEWSPS